MKFPQFKFNNFKFAREVILNLTTAQKCIVQEQKKVREKMTGRNIIEVE